MPGAGEDRMLNEFKRFLLRGNVVDLGVGVVIGVAFKSVVDAFVADLLTPMVAAVGGQADFSELAFSIRGSTFLYGHFLNILISFVITAAVVFFLVMQPMNHLVDRYRREETPEPTTRKCPYCYQEINLHASRCPYCTSQVEPAMAA
jgi:large conductance mechanosensitive channel